MLSELKKTNAISPIKDTFKGVFNDLMKRVGFYDSSGDKDYGEARLQGDYLRMGINFSKATPGGPYSVGIIAVHETFHAAARQGLYSEYDIAKAAYDLGRQQGLIPDLVPEPVKGDSEEAEAYNGRLINQTILTACGGK